MAEFDESKVINALHTDKAEVGKKYWFADCISELKDKVENNAEDVKTLDGIYCNNYYPFQCGNAWQFLYPYEEPSEQRMTHRMLSEWIAKGNGEYTHSSYENIYTNFSYDKEYENEEVSKDDLIRPWDSDEWQVPTVDIYERDCKGGKEC